MDISIPHQVLGIVKYLAFIPAVNVARSGPSKTES